MKTGRAVLSHQLEIEGNIATACLDYRGKKLITGTVNGEIKEWNFHSGSMLHEYKEIPSTELSQLFYLNRNRHPLIGIGKGCHIVMWPDSHASEVSSFF